MQGSTAALALVLATAALCTPASAFPLASDTTPCCFSYISRSVPRAHIQDYFYTSSKCSMPAVVFVTRKKLKVCANPEDRWVQKYINLMEMS